MCGFLPLQMLSEAILTMGDIHFAPFCIPVTLKVVQCCLGFSDLAVGYTLITVVLFYVYLHFGNLAPLKVC